MVSSLLDTGLRPNIFTWTDNSQAPTLKKTYLRIGSVIRKSSRTIFFMTWRCSKLFFKSSAIFYCKFCYSNGWRSCRGVRKYPKLISQSSQKHLTIFKIVKCFWKEILKIIKYSCKDRQISCKNHLIFL